jgi:hypothetical protein
MIEIIHAQEALMVRDAIVGDDSARSAEAQAILDKWISEAETGALSFTDEARNVLSELLPDWL